MRHKKVHSVFRCFKRNNSAANSPDKRKFRELSALLLSVSLALMPGHIVSAQSVAAPTQAHETGPAQPPGSPVAPPSVPAAASVLTPEVLSALAPVVNPQQLVIDVSTLSTPGVMSFSGNWTNTDNLVLISTSSAVQTAQISAANIFIPVGTSISTIVPSGYSNAIQNLNLSLIAQNAIYNAGHIVASGNLSMSAPVIANVAPATVSPSLASAAQASISSIAGNISMQASTIINQATVTAAMGNINLSSLTSALAVNSIGGSFNAGNINFAPQGLGQSLNIDILGGNFISNLLNIETGDAGALNLAAESISSQVNVNAGVFASIQVANGALNIGNLYSEGDPFVTNENGDVTFSGSTDVAFLNINANGKILADFSEGPVTINSKSSLLLSAADSIVLDGTTISSELAEIRLQSNFGNISISGSKLLAQSSVNLNAGGDIIAANALISGSSVFAEGKSLVIPGTQIEATHQGGGIVLHATEGSINAAGTAQSPVPSFTTNQSQIYMVSDTEGILIPGAQMKSSGGNIVLVAAKDIDLGFDAVSYSGAPALIDSGRKEEAGGYIFLASTAGSVKTGPASSITVGEMAPPTVSVGSTAVLLPISIGAFNGITVGDLHAPAGDLIMGSGFETTGAFDQQWQLHIHDINQSNPQGFHRGHGFGGIQASNINIGLNGEGKAGIYVESSNGAASFGSITGDGANVKLYTSETVGSSLSISDGVVNTNQSNSQASPNVFIGSTGALDITGGILNSNQAGDGGIVGLVCSDQDGITLGAGGIEITNESSANSGTVSVINSSLFTESGGLYEGGSISYNTGGIITNSSGRGATISLISEGDISMVGSIDASATGTDSIGGIIQLSGENLHLEGSEIRADGTGAGQGGVVELTGRVHGAGALVNASSPGGDGGQITIVGELHGSGLSLIANGGSEGVGGQIGIFSFEDQELHLAQGDLLATAQGGYGGGRFSAEADSHLTVDSKVFNIAPYKDSNGNGGSIQLRSLQGDLSTIGNLRADGEGTGSGGEIALHSGKGDFTVGNGGSQLYARSGTEGGDGGRIFVTAGKNLTIAPDATVNAHVRGDQGNGGLVELTGGASEPGGVTIDSTFR